jgi:hypothetical protein
VSGIKGSKAEKSGFVSEKNEWKTDFLGVERRKTRIFSMIRAAFLFR